MNLVNTLKKEYILQIRNYIPQMIKDIEGQCLDFCYLNTVIYEIVENQFKLVDIFFKKPLDEGTLRHSIYLTFLMSNYIQFVKGSVKEINPSVHSSLIIGCLLHDIGKSVDWIQDIVNQKRVLTIEEYEKVKKHTDTGYDLLKDIGITDNNILEIVLMHGVRGVSLNGIITLVAIMDSFEAMTSQYRPYRQPMSIKDALYSLRRDCDSNLYGNEGISYFESFEQSLSTFGIVNEYMIMDVNQSVFLYE
jgi:putative nucleotidyltransferase with HDIG domain